VVEDVQVELYGEIRLARPPINKIMRIQSYPLTALTVSNGTADTAWVYAATTGDLASGLTITGLTLNWISAGVVSTSTVTFSSLADQRISTLATAIDAVGSGWSATADPTLGDWPVSELLNTPEGAGAGPDDQPYGATQYLVYSRNLTTYYPNVDGGERTGLYVVGRQQGSSDAQRWGPGGETVFDGYGYGGGRWPDRVKVTYDGGFATIPREVQLATVELAKQQLHRLGIDLTLRSETAGEYSYTIDPAQVDALPKWVLQALSRHRITNA
jgi:hypothetical protein